MEYHSKVLLHHFELMLMHASMSFDAYSCLGVLVMIVGRTCYQFEMQIIVSRDW